MKAKIISIATQKGGASKTTTSVNLASCIAMRATPVLLIDIDPQNSSTDWLMMMEENKQKLFDFIKAEPSNIEKIIKDNIGIYKYIVIDCAPRLEKVIAQVINNSDLILTPVGLGAIESWAFDDFNESVKHRQELTGGQPIQKVFMSNVDVRYKRLINQTEEGIEKLGFETLQTIYHREVVVHAPGIGKCTVHMDDPKASYEIETLTTQVLELVHDI